MRVRIELSKIKNLPYDYQYHLLGVIHKWLGENNAWHDATSLYSYSNIQNLHAFGGSLHGEKPYILFACYEKAQMDRIIFGATKDSLLFGGIEVTSIKQVGFNINREVFLTASPIFLRDIEEKHLLFSDRQSNAYLTKVARNKLKLAGIDEAVNVSFVGEGKSKLVRIKNIQNRCSQSKIQIEGSNIAKHFLGEVGVGHSTGSGFGFLV